MLRDVFYYGEKPNAHPRERHAENFEQARQLARTEHFWIVHELCDYQNFDWDFDFDFLPDEDTWAENHINIWPSQHQKDSGTWLCSKTDSDIKIYRNDVDPIQRRNIVTDKWTVPDDMTVNNFDFSWHPDPTSPPYRYKFHTFFDMDPLPVYTDIGGVETIMKSLDDEQLYGHIYPKYYIQSTLEVLINQHPDEIFWALNPDLDYKNFNFEWKLSKETLEYVNAFGNKDSTNTHTYFVSSKMWHRGYKDIKYIDNVVMQIKTTIAMFYVDKGNLNSQSHYENLKKLYPNLEKTRYIGSWIDTITRCCNKSSSSLFWILSSEIDYSTFKFEYYPSPWHTEMLHVFGTQWSHWGNTYLVNKNTFAEQTRYINVIEHTRALNFIKSSRAATQAFLHDIVLIDHGNENNIANVLKEKTSRNVTTVTYDTTYKDTFTKILDQLPVQDDHYIWICSSICDYTAFDFSYVCDPYTKEQLHVFPSEKQKFGDTFLVNVNLLRKLLPVTQSLKDYDKINFNNHQVTPRLPSPVFNTGSDTHTDSINSVHDFPYATYIVNGCPGDIIDREPLSMWSLEDKKILITTTGATRIIVPKEAAAVHGELYNYPNISTSSSVRNSTPLDIIFFSNGEVIADDNYQKLLISTRNSSNRVVRVDGINGRVASQHAAANASNTPWYFLVNAKLRVHRDFDWSWQPDRLQIPKHYIFTATNPVNHLEYGHQAIVANNKNITLNTIVKGLDFTMDGEHEVVKVNSGIGMYNTSVWDTWRTAFRETLKLKAYTEKNDDLEAKFRLSSWLNLGDGDFGSISMDAALDACRYYESVNGELEKLRLSYDWAWLRSHYEKLYP